MIKINLLPGKEKRDFLRVDLYLFFLVLAIALASFGAVYYANEHEIANYNKKIETTKKQIAELQSVYKEYLTIDQQKKEIQRRIKAIDSIKEGRALSARALFDLTSVIKDSVWLKTFKKTEDKFEMDGRSLENESISNLIETLSKVPYLKNVELRSVEDAVEDGMAVKKFVIIGDIML
jgi:Tfp pilus assembly protein PilN